MHTNLNLLYCMYDRAAAKARVTKSGENMVISLNNDTTPCLCTGLCTHPRNVRDRCVTKRRRFAVYAQTVQWLPVLSVRWFRYMWLRLSDRTTGRQVRRDRRTVSTDCRTPFVLTSLQYQSKSEIFPEGKYVFHGSGRFFYWSMWWSYTCIIQSSNVGWRIW